MFVGSSGASCTSSLSDLIISWPTVARDNSSWALNKFLKKIMFVNIIPTFSKIVFYLAIYQQI